MWNINKRHSGTSRAIGFILLLAAFLGTAWVVASWAEQNRGLGFGPVFTLVSLLEGILCLGLFVNIPEEMQKSHNASLKQKHTA